MNIRHTARILGILALLGACNDVPEGVPLAKRLFVVDQSTAAEDQVLEGGDPTLVAR